MRFGLTGQEWWPRAKQQAHLAIAHLSLQLKILSHGNTLYSSHTGISSKLLQGMNMAVLLYQITLKIEKVCTFVDFVQDLHFRSLCLLINRMYRITLLPLLLNPDHLK